MNDLGGAFKVVLVEASHAGNIGAAARAMKNMGFSRLSLVRPRRFPCAEAGARAAGADDVLDAAQVCDSLAESLADCVLAVATTARSRNLSWPTLSPRRAAPRLAAAAADGGAVALVFGNERSGLSNADLELCHFAVSIPTAPNFPSLNLAAAVQLLCYELALTCAAPAASPEAPERRPEAPFANAREMELLFAHLEQCLREVDFLNPAQPRLLMRRLRRLFHRARPDRNELNILRGFLAAVQRRLSEAPRGAPRQDPGAEDTRR